MLRYVVSITKVKLALWWRRVNVSTDSKSGCIAYLKSETGPQMEEELVFNWIEIWYLVFVVSVTGVELALQWRRLIVSIVLRVDTNDVNISPNLTTKCSRRNEDKTT